MRFFGRVGKMISGNSVPSDAYGYFEDCRLKLDQESLNDYRTMRRKLKLRATDLERKLGVKPGDIFLVPRKRTYTQQFYLVEDLQFEDVGKTISIIERGLSVGSEPLSTASYDLPVWRMLYVGLRVVRDLNVGSFYLAATFLINEQLVGTGIATTVQSARSMLRWSYPDAKRSLWRQLYAPESRRLYRKQYGISASPADGCVFLGEQSPKLDQLLFARLFEEFLKKEVSGYAE